VPQRRGERGISNSLEYCGKVLIHGLVGEAKDPIPRLRQDSISRCILRIEFDGEAALSAAEIEYEWSYGMLPAKLETVQPPTA